MSDEDVGVAKPVQRVGAMVQLEIALHVRLLGRRRGIDEREARSTLLDVVGDSQPQVPVVVDGVLRTDLQSRDVEADVMSMRRHGCYLARSRDSLCRVVRCFESEAAHDVEGQPQLTLFLASDMSSYITGQVINVDGGMLM